MRVLALLPVVLTVLLMGAPGTAAADESDEGRRYNGSSIVGGILGGAHLLSAPHDGQLSYLVGGFVRFNTVMTAFAAQIQYDFAPHSLIVPDATGNGQTVEVQQHGLSLSVHYHPMFLRLLTNNYAWYVISAWYIELGGGVDMVLLDSPALGIDKTRFGATLHLGTGIEAPLGEADDQGAFWLGAGWRWKFLLADILLGDQDDLHSHSLHVWLAYRWNNTSFTRVKRPPELKWR
jgi:hypothetical protein